MGKVLVSAAAGVVAALLVMAAFVFGAHFSPELLMMIAAALSVGAAVAVLTRLIVDAPTKRTDREKFLSRRLRDVRGLIDAFPDKPRVIRSDTGPDDLDIVRNPEKYTDQDICLHIKEGSKTFNPVTLRKIFLALQQRPNFLHLLLIDKHDEFVGYIPGHMAKKEFTGDDAEARIADYIVRVFEDHANGANLHAINGLSNSDTINDEDSLARALDRLQGGFQRLVVLHGGYHRKPVGLLHAERLVSATKAE